MMNSATVRGSGSENGSGPAYVFLQGLLLAPTAAKCTKFNTAQPWSETKKISTCILTCNGHRQYEILDQTTC